MLSVLCCYIFKPNGMERFNPCHVLQAQLKIESRKLENTDKVALFVHLQASSEILSMQPHLYYFYFKTVLLPFKAQNIFISAVSLKMRQSIWQMEIIMENDLLRENHENMKNLVTFLRPMNLITEKIQTNLQI